MSKIKVHVYSYKSINNSASGNPRFELNTDNGRYRTGPDHAFNYDIRNWDRAGKLTGRSVVLDLTRNGVVQGIELDNDPENFIVKHDNVKVAGPFTENQAYSWLQRHNSFSSDHAIKYEGYSIDKL